MKRRMDSKQVLFYGKNKNIKNVFSKLQLDFKINNIFNSLYETSGYVSYGVPYWLPAATTNYYAELKVGF